MPGEPLPFPARQLSYGALLVRLPGRRRAHFVPTISQVRSVLEVDGFPPWPVTEPAWQATTTVCGRPEPWDRDWGPDAGFPILAQLCDACQRGLEAAYAGAPVPLRPS
jgi:hypothetical protein